MKENIFNSENEMQQWLSNYFKDNDGLNDIIVNIEEFDVKQISLEASEAKVVENYKYCLESLNMVSVLSENENISLKAGDILKPDFLLYAPETQSMVILELKHLVTPSRQAGTEVSAYANEIRSYIPFIADGDIINVVISSVWPSLLTHYIFHEIFWLQRNILCLQPIKEGGEIKLEIVNPKKIAENNVALKLSPQLLGGYRLCLYDDFLNEERRNADRLDKYLPQMKTALAAMATKGNAHKNNGFAFLWRDKWELSLAPYNITIINVAPFQSIERLFHQRDYMPNETAKKLIQVVLDHDPEGHGYSLETISKYGERFLEDICSVRPEGFNTWDIHRRDITKDSELLAFAGWGVIGELYSDKLLHMYKQGVFTIRADNPQIGLALLDELIDEEYEFIDISSLYFNEDEYEGDMEQDNEEENYQEI